ncbi:hypothetical protein AVEN_143677-1 [Araneus ventricosus]|uniref:Uncharacterized protein n=1 Tax=Araneus ventricosus TaxID=182803 RepID=A0A4Y2ANL0_ARAVE|nr:hypothetical protein AVEN_143677-1 [Araneus ventricosus]
MTLRHRSIGGFLSRRQGRRELSLRQNTGLKMHNPNDKNIEMVDSSSNTDVPMENTNLSDPHIIPFDSENGMKMELWLQYFNETCRQHNKNEGWKTQLCPLRQPQFTCDLPITNNSVTQCIGKSVSSSQVTNGKENIANDRQNPSTEASGPVHWQLLVSGHISTVPDPSNLVHSPTSRP